MLTPMDIHDHQFKKSFRGYNENEVDDFLDRVVDDFEKLLRENERLKTQVHTTEKELEHFRKLEKTLNDTLMMAQRTADEVISAARRNADDLKENAARDCQIIRDNAALEAKQHIDGALVKRNAILAEYEKFVREKKAFLMKLRTILESELTITVQTLEDLPNVDEAVKNVLPADIPAVESAPDEKISDEPAPVDEPVAEPVAEVAEPVESEPVEPVAPVKPVEPVEPAAEVAELSNLVDVSTKPVTVEKSKVTDDTITFAPVKPKKGSSN